MLMTISLGHSTNTGDVLTSVISYYRQHDSSVSIYFIDFTKAVENIGVARIFAAGCTVLLPQMVMTLISQFIQFSIYTKYP